MGVEKQTEDVESQTSNVDHQIENAKHAKLEPKLEQGRANELEINFQDEPVEDQRRKLLVLEKYVRRHHKPEQIIGDVESSIMTRRRLKDNACLLCEFEPKSIKDALDNEDWI